MSDGAPLLIPFAACLAPGCGEALRATPLPHLARLLGRLRPGTRVAGEETALSMPHEVVLASTLGLPHGDGRIPFAAHHARRMEIAAAGDAWCWITPCHWRVGTDHVAMDVVADLQLEESESRALLEAMRPYFEEDGIELRFHAPTQWLARGEVFRDLPCASLDRVEGRVIDAWMPRTPTASTLRRLQQEMQMLLYTHPVTDARTERGLMPVTSFWASGAGALPPGATPTDNNTLRAIDTLRGPALHEDWSAWSTAWRAIDANECARLLDALQAGQPIQLTLAGERHAQTWTSEGSGGVMRRLAGMITRVQPAEILSTL